MSVERLMRVKIRQKKRKPEFKRYEWNKKIRLRNKMWSWRRPRGIDNKLRLQKGGKWSGRILVKIGFGSPKAVRGLHPCGLEDVLVHNVKELEALDPKRHAIRVASTVGMKKRLEIEAKAEEMGFKILNPKTR
ncbi:MAG: 50S ribosomal protein L32e [Archaeoglobaceae archaeon]